MRFSDDPHFGCIMWMIFIGAALFVVQKLRVDGIGAVVVGIVVVAALYFLFDDN